MKNRLFCLVALLLTLATGSAFSQTVPFNMNFQGRLANPDNTAVPDSDATHIYNIIYRIYDQPVMGHKLWEQEFDNIKVVNSNYAVSLDFTLMSPNYKNGNTLVSIFGTQGTMPWLEIQVLLPMSQPKPRKPFASVAYAFYAGTALSALSVPDGSITNASIVSVDWSKITNVPANLGGGGGWSLTGNLQTDPLLDFLGTTDLKPLLFKVNNQQAMRYDYVSDGSYTGINVLGGYQNSISSGVVAATIAGGGVFSLPNTVTDDGGTIGGGVGNLAGDNDGAIFATVAGGYYNEASDQGATVAGGFYNSAYNDDTTIGGGYANVATGLYATVGGGAFNTASGNCAAIAGGYNNTAAGQFSFVAGQQAQANQDGSFVWNDSFDQTYGHFFKSTGPNQFLIHATGGVGINTNNPAGFALNVVGSANVSSNVQVGGFIMPTGASNHKVLASDMNGTGTWQNVLDLIGPNSITSSQIASVAWGKITDAPNAFPPNGAASGDLTGMYPGPTIADGKVTTTKIADGSVTNAKIDSVAWSKITGTPNAFPPNGAAGGDLTGTYPNPTIADGKVTDAKIASVAWSKITGVPGNIGSGWSLNGNAITSTNFLGTTNNQPLVIKVGDPNNIAHQAMLYNYVDDGTENSINVLGGSEINSITPGIFGATIAGGGITVNGSLLFPNTVTASLGTVGGGALNTVSGNYSIIAGGSSNTASGQSAAVGGGYTNTASGLYSTVPGGQNNIAAGNNSFAAGSGAWAKIGHNSTFVWNDGGGTFASTGANQFLIHATGGVGINTNSPSPYALSINGTAHCTNSVWSSDIRYKTNVISLNNALEDVLSLRGVSYDWDRAKWPDMKFAEGKQIGFIAQELEQIFPELVSTDTLGYKSVNYIGVVPVAVEAIKMLNAKVNAQQKQIDELQKQNAHIAELEKQLAAVLTALKQMQTTPDAAQK